MPYRASWRLVGADGRILDRGDLDRVHEHRAEAITEILLQLENFALHGSDEHCTEWWAKRSSNASIETRFRSGGEDGNCLIASPALKCCCY